MSESPRLTQKELAYLDNCGAHFKWKDMCARLKNMLATNAQTKRSQQLLLYQQVFSANMTDKLVSRAAEQHQKLDEAVRRSSSKLNNKIKAIAEEKAQESGSKKQRRHNSIETNPDQYPDQPGVPNVGITGSNIPINNQRQKQSPGKKLVDKQRKAAFDLMKGDEMNKDIKLAMESN